MALTAFHPLRYISSQTAKKDGKVHDSHKTIASVIISPAENQVFPLTPEFIVP